MTITWMDGFDLYNSTNNGLAAGYSSFPTGNNYATGRFGVGQCLDAANAAIQYPINNGATTDQFSFGVAFKVTSLNHEILTLMNGTNPCGHLRVNATGAFEAIRGDFAATIGTSAGGLISLNTWNYVEVEWVKSATVGVFKVYLNGVQVLNLTGVNTGTTAPDGLRTYWPQEFFLDDLYVTNTSTKLGEVRIDTFHPTADTAQKDWTPSTGTDNYAMLDEAQISQTDYVSASTAGAKDYYDVGDIGFNPLTIHAVKVVSMAKKDDATTRTFRNKLKSSATEADGATRGLGTSYAIYGDIFEQNPNGSVAWTQASVNALQAGIEIVS